MGDNNDNVNQIFGYNYDEDIQKIQNYISNMERNKHNVSDEEYIEDKQYYINLLNDTLEKKANQEQIYSSITNDNDRKIYAQYDRLVNGTFNEDDKIFKDKAWQIQDKRTDSYINRYNSFFTNQKVVAGSTIDKIVVDSKDIKMGKILYNKIIKAAEEQNIDLRSIGIESDASLNKFTIKHNKEAFVTFSKLYGESIDNTFLKGAFVNTANELLTVDQLFSDSANFGTEGTQLYDFYKEYKYIEYHKKKLDDKYHIYDYYTPITSPGNKDILFTIDYMSGKKSTELKIVNEEIKDAIQGANLLKYTVYGNVEDIKAKNGGIGALSEIKDDQLKKTIMDNIYSEYGGGALDKDDQHGKLQYDFSTSGYNYGTWIRIPKGTGFYEIYVENLLPSKEAEMYIQSPKFKASAYIEHGNNVAIGDRIYRNDLGSIFSGSFKAYGNDIYSYTLDGTETNQEGKEVPKKEVSLSKDEAIALKMYSDLFKRFSIENGYSETSPYKEEDIIKFIYNRDEADPISFMDILSKVSGLPENQIQNYLLDMYKTYYKK